MRCSTRKPQRPDRPDGKDEIGLYLFRLRGQTPRWQGQCPHCSAWNTLVEGPAEQGGTSRHRYASIAGTSSGPRVLAEIQPRESPRVPTGIDEFDRVLGGGLVPGGVVLIGGDPGIGKSTLLLQALSVLADRLPTLYVTGEESAEQVALRAQRLQLIPGGLQILPEISLERILGVLTETKPKVAVIDSIQTVYSETCSRRRAPSDKCANVQHNLRDTPNSRA